MTRNKKSKVSQGRYNPKCWPCCRFKRFRLMNNPVCSSFHITSQDNRSILWRVYISTRGSDSAILWLKCIPLFEKQVTWLAHSTRSSQWKCKLKKQYIKLFELIPLICGLNWFMKMNNVPDCASLNGGHTAPATAACRSTVPPLGWRLCFLHAGGEVGGDWWGDTTGDVVSGWGQKTQNIKFS